MVPKCALPHHCTTTNTSGWAEEASLWKGFTSGHLQRKDLTALEISEEEERERLIPAFKAQLHPSPSLCINLMLPCLEKALGEESWHLWTAKNIQ